MKRLTVDQVQALLPDAEELRPLIDRIIVLSEADPSRRWSGSGELVTVGQRLVSLDLVERETAALAQAIRRHVEGTYRQTVRALEALANGDREGAVDLFLELAKRESELGRVREAYGYVRSALQVASGLEDPDRTVEASLQGARIARARADFDAAETHYRQAFEVASSTGRTSEALTALVGTGNLFVDRGRWDEAESWYHRALALMEEEGLRGPQEWHAALNLSIVHRMKGDFETSETWLDRAEEGHPTHPEPAGPSLLANARGQLLMAKGKPGLAEAHLREAVDRATDRDARVAMLVNLGECLLALGRVLDAAEEGRRAEEEAVLGPVVSRLPEVYRLLGRVAGARGLDDGFVFFERAVDIVRQRDLPRFELAQSLEAYGEFEVERGLRAPGGERLRSAAGIYEELGSRALADAALAKVPTGNGDPRDHEGGGRHHG